MLEEQSDLESHLVDLTDVPLSELAVRNESALARALQRVTREAGDPQNVVAGFESTI